MSEPFDSFAERIVRNGEYKHIIDAIIKQGGSLSELVSAVNAHRYTTKPVKEFTPQKWQVSE